MGDVARPAPFSFDPIAFAAMTGAAHDTLFQLSSTVRSDSRSALSTMAGGLRLDSRW
jgi:hypothetical protein